MKKYNIVFEKGNTMELWASNDHNARQIAIGYCACLTGKSQETINNEIVAVKQVN